MDRRDAGTGTPRRLRKAHDRPVPTRRATPRARGRARATVRIVVAVLAVASFVVSLVLQATLYRHGSGDADEAAYVLQARMLLDGKLTLDAAKVGPFFRPWLTGEIDGRLFTKYLPGWPAALAVSQFLFGTMVVAPATVAAAWVVGAYRLAKELFDEATGLVAAVFVALSPLVVLHTALTLSYAFTVVLLTLGSAALLRGVRTGSRISLLAGGAGFGLALLSRPFDAVLVALPCVVHAAVRTQTGDAGADSTPTPEPMSGPRQGPWPARTPTPGATPGTEPTPTAGTGAAPGSGLRARLRVGLRRLPWALLGALPFVGMLFAYCAHVTGSPLRLPLSASDPLDKFGFGPRRILPSESTFSFTQDAAVDALRETIAAFPGWMFGGVITAVFVFVGLVAPGRRGLAARAMLAAIVLAVCAGYFFWWGSAFAVPGLLTGLGPHYHVAAFTPLVVLAAVGVRWVWTAVAGWNWPSASASASVATSNSNLTSASASVTRRQASQWLRPGLLGACACACAFALFAVTAFGVPDKVATQRFVNDTNMFLAALLPDDLPTPAAVVVTPNEPSRYTQVPYHTLRNDPNLSGPVIYAVDLGAAIVGLPDVVPGRQLFRLRPGEILDPAAPASYFGSFTALRSVEGRRIAIEVTVHQPRPTPTDAVVDNASAERSCGAIYVRFADQTRGLAGNPVAPGTLAARLTLRTDSPAAGLGSDELSLDRMRLPAELVVGCVGSPPGDTPDSVRVSAPDSGPDNASGTAVPGTAGGTSVGTKADTADTGGMAAAWWWEERIPVGLTTGGDLRLLVPGLGWRLVPGRYGRAWVPATVSETLRVAASPAS